MSEVIVPSKRYRVHMHSKPGMWTYYDGYVDVWADDESCAINRALDKVKSGTFSDRPRDAWVIDKVEEL